LALGCFCCYSGLGRSVMTPSWVLFASSDVEVPPDGLGGKSSAV
jgi:hypothetical protein